VRFEETGLPPACLVIAEPRSDERGSFSRLHCEREFAAAGLDQRVVQTNLSRTHHRGTIRGMHYQVPPSSEAKLVRCISGRIYDVIIDLRRDSPKFLRHFGVELGESAETALYVPAGFAHGFQTLEDDAVVLYQMTDFYAAELGRGVRWNDPAFGIVWPLNHPALNERDANYPDFNVAATFV
jgi:dTDP-4-dehydrorhamnose 3,5-epimerase